jgi:hypothetical protein
VSLSGRASALVGVTLTVPATASGLDSTAFREVGGYVTLTPTGGTNGGSIINVPYYAVPRARADVSGAVLEPFSKRHPSTTAVVQNNSTKVNGKADIYSLGGAGDKSLGQLGIRALGVKTGAATNGNAADRLVTFAFNTNKPNATVDIGNISFQVDITLAGNDPAHPDYSVFTEDVGLATGGGYTGQIGVIVVNNNTGNGIIRFLATAPTDGSLVLMPTLASDIGLNAAEPRFTYQGYSFFFADDPRNSGLLTDQTATAVFNAWNPAISASVANPAGGTLPLTLTPGQLAQINLNIDPIEWNVTPTDGVMIVTRENPTSGAHPQALLFKVRP